MQNFGGTTKRIMVFLKKDYCRVNYHKLALNKFESTAGKKRANFPNFSVDNKSEES